MGKRAKPLRPEVENQPTFCEVEGCPSVKIGLRLSLEVEALRKENRLLKRELAKLSRAPKQTGNTHA